MNELPKSLDVLKNLPHWVCYRKKWSDQRQKYSKIPFSPVTGRGAAADDPNTWTTYTNAADYAQAHNLDGVGFELGNAGIAGIDIDDCIDDQGNLSAMAKSIVGALDSYTEYSPSGKGIHIFVFSSFYAGNKNDDIGLEIYRPRIRTDEEKEKIFNLDQKQPIEKRKYKSISDVGIIQGGRYLTITGKVYGAEKPINERTAVLKQIMSKYMQTAKKAPVETSTPPVVASYENNYDILRKMFNSSKGAAIKALFDGNMSAYNDDHSRADQALIDDLVYWTKGNAEKTDELFRQSALMRDKWDEMRGTQTYGQMTIAKALADYTPYTPPVRTNAAQDFKEHVQHNNTTSVAEVEPEHENNPKQDKPRPDAVSSYIGDVMGADLSRFQAFKDRKTGYSNLDRETSLYPGLYCIGAISSLGKTTWVHELCDQVAEKGDHVLYFSLEQSRLEMVTKGISRETAKITNIKKFDGAVSAIDIRRGAKGDILVEAANNYMKLAETESVIECGFDTTIEDITSYVLDYMKYNNGIKPIVVVDYLQIIRPLDPRQSTKDAVDTNVRALKMLQRDNDLVVIVICSLNRSNYLTPVDFESFKESGGIEYTADVVWGLQLSVVTSEAFLKEKSIINQRNMVRAAKDNKIQCGGKEFICRNIDLVCLKNRYGRSSFGENVAFKYYPQFDYFVPTTDFDYIGE